LTDNVDLMFLFIFIYMRLLLIKIVK